MKLELDDFYIFNLEFTIWGTTVMGRIYIASIICLCDSSLTYDLSYCYTSRLIYSARNDSDGENIILL